MPSTDHQPLPCRATARLPRRHGGRGGRRGRRAGRALRRRARGRGRWVGGRRRLRSRHHRCAAAAGTWRSWPLGVDGAPGACRWPAAAAEAARTARPCVLPRCPPDAPSYANRALGGDLAAGGEAGYSGGLADTGAQGAGARRARALGGGGRSQRRSSRRRRPCLHALVAHKLSQSCSSRDDSPLRTGAPQRGDRAPGHAGQGGDAQRGRAGGPLSAHTAQGGRRRFAERCRAGPLPPAPVPCSPGTPCSAPARCDTVSVAALAPRRRQLGVTGGGGCSSGGELRES